MIKKILFWLNVYEEEISLVLWTTLLLFIVRSSGVILNNYAETAFLKRYGVEFMPAVNMVNAIATIFITGALTGILNRVSGGRVLACVFLASGLTVTGIRLLIPFGLDLLYPLLFMLKSQFEMIQAMLYWNICNDLFNTRQSKRLFPLLTAGGVIGLILGSMATPYFARQFNLDNLLYLYLATTLAGTAVVSAMGRNYASMIYQKPSAPKGKDKKSFREEITQLVPLIKESILFKVVLVITFMPNVVVPIMNYQFNFAIDNQFASEAAVLKFFGYFRGAQYTVSLFILLFVGRIYGRWGLPVALMFHPFNYMIAFLAFLFRFDVISAMYARMSTNILRTTINVPANGILIGMFPEQYRNQVRPFLRGTVVRVALFTGSTLILISTSLFHPRYLTLVALPFVLAWLAAPIYLKFKYSTMLKHLISNNLLDIKSFSKKELGQIFKENTLQSDLEKNFLSARGTDALWYASLLKNLSEDALDEKILQALPHQDEATQVALIKMISPGSHTSAARRLIPFLDPRHPETAIAIFKLAWQQGIQIPKTLDLTPYTAHTDPVVRGFATALSPPGQGTDPGLTIENRLNAVDLEERRSGIISAGLSKNLKFADRLLDMLSEKDIDPIIPDIIIALSRLEAPQLNLVIFSFLSHKNKPVRLAALDALKIDNDITLKKTIFMLGDSSEEISQFARDKIRQADYRNGKLLLESLALPGARRRKGLFALLEHLEIKEFNIMVFSRSQTIKCYTCLAMVENLNQLPPTPANQLAADHLLEKKDKIIENTLRVLAIHDKTGRMKTAWQGFFSSNLHQRANAIELLNDMLDRKSAKAVLPLLESPSPEIALEKGRTITQIPALDSGGRTTLNMLLTSQDWVDAAMGLFIIRQTPDLIGTSALKEAVSHLTSPVIEKELDMIIRTQSRNDDQPESTDTGEIPIGEKILLLREIDIFSGLSAEELAAIAAETREKDFGESETVIRQGETGETVYLIVEGKVAVIKELAEDNHVVLDHIATGQAFGEMALIDDAPRSATIRTVSPCRFLVLHKQEFKETAMEFPRISLQICSVLSRRIRDLHKKFQESKAS